LARCWCSCSLAFGAVRYATSVSTAPDGGLVPPPRFGLRNLFEMLADTIFGLMVSVMGEKEARRFLPLIGTPVLLHSVLELAVADPGLYPAHRHVEDQNPGAVGDGVLLTHIYGVRAHGIKYFKHFLGPFLPLAPLMLPIELISHIARPVSLPCVCSATSAPTTPSCWRSSA